MIHVMAAIGLGGTAMAAPVVGYDTIALLEEEQHLHVPIIVRQRPAVAKHDGLSFAPVLVVDFRRLFRCNCRHVCSPFSMMFCLRDRQTRILGMHFSQTLTTDGFGQEPCPAL